MYIHAKTDKKSLKDTKEHNDEKRGLDIKAMGKTHSFNHNQIPQDQYKHHFVTQW